MAGGPRAAWRKQNATWRKGIPGIAVVTQSTQNADNTGDDENRPAQANPVTVKPTVR